MLTEAKQSRLFLRYTKKARGLENSTGSSSTAVNKRRGNLTQGSPSKGSLDISGSPSLYSGQVRLRIGEICHFLSDMAKHIVRFHRLSELPIESSLPSFQLEAIQLTYGLVNNRLIGYNKGYNKKLSCITLAYDGCGMDG